MSDQRKLQDSTSTNSHPSITIKINTISPNAQISYTKPNELIKFSDRKPIKEVHLAIFKFLDEFGAIGQLNIDCDINPEVFLKPMIQEVGLRRQKNPEFSLKVVRLDWKCVAEEDDGCLKRFLGVCRNFVMEDLMAAHLKLSPKKLYVLVQTIAGKLAPPDSLEFKPRPSFQLSLDSPIKLRDVIKLIDPRIKKEDVLVMVNMKMKGAAHIVTIRFWEQMVAAIALELPVFCLAEEFFNKMESPSKD